MLNRLEKDAIENNPPKIGTLLVNEGFIRNADLAQAIEIQEKELGQAELPLGKLLVKKKLIDRRQLQSLLQHPELVGEIEAFAVEKAGVHPGDLARCISEKPAGQPLAEALAAAGYLTDDDLKLFFEEQIDSLKICELAVETGMVSESDMTRVLQSKRTPRTIGEILCDLNLITPLDLNAVLSKHRKHLRLGDILLKHGLIDEAAFGRALEMHERRGQPLGSILCSEGLLTEDQLYGAFARQYNIPFERLDGFEYGPGQRELLTGIVGKTFSDQFHIVPLRLEGSTLTLAVADPANLEIVHSLRSKRVDLRTGCVLVTPATMQRLYTGLYGARPAFAAPEPARPTAPPPDRPLETPSPEPPPTVTEKSESPAPAAAGTASPRVDTETDPPQADAAPSAPPPAPRKTPDKAAVGAGQLVNLMLREALSRGARAIHMDQGLRRTTLTLRIGDSLEAPSGAWPDDIFQGMADQVMDAVKEIAGMDTGSRHRPQEGMFRAGMADPATGTPDLDFTVTSCPTLAGESMTIRCISPCAPAPDLSELPHSRHVVASLREAMKHTAGMFLVAAPPGNDRAATLYGMLRHIHGPGLKAVTVDGAISFSMPEAVQTQANPSMGLPFAAMLRTALRLDPDIVLAEDLGDPESLLLGIEAARRGARLLGGINARDGAGAVSEMGAFGPPAQTAGLLKAVLTQRYVRKICPNCRQVYTPSPEEWQPLFEHLPEGLTFYRGAGCTECDFTGYRGRVLLSELLVIGDVIARALKQQLPENDIRHLVIRSGTKTLIDDGLSRLDETTLSEIVDAVPAEAADAFKCIRADIRPAARPAPAGEPPPRRPAPEEAAPAREEKAAFEIVLSPGTFPKADIQRLHHAYEVLMEETGSRTRPSALATFETFIRAHHSALCRRYGCSRVVFSVERQNGKPVLLATPVLR